MAYTAALGCSILAVLACPLVLIYALSSLRTRIRRPSTYEVVFRAPSSWRGRADVAPKRQPRIAMPDLTLVRAAAQA